MELELEIDPEAVAEIPGLRPLAAARDGRARGQAVKVVWHDSPDHALLGQGLTVAERRGTWRLERVTPSRETWLPGQPPPVVEEAGERRFKSVDVPPTLTPVAAFEGRRTVSVHRLAAPPATPADSTGCTGSPSSAATSQAATAAVTLTVERGVLRAVAAEQPVARMTLSGEDHAVHAAAMMIAGAVPASIPCASLAAQAFALATGGVPAPRHLGAPVLPHPGLSVDGALAHILGHLTDVVLHFAPVAALPGPNGRQGHGQGEKNPVEASPADTGQPEPAVRDAGQARADPAAEAPDARRTEAVHQMRVAVRRALSAASIFRDALPAGTLDPVRDGLKALGARLGQTRDWDVFVGETAPMVTQAMAPDERLDRLVAAAARRQRDCRKALADYLASPAFRALGIELAWFAAATFWHAGGTPPGADRSGAHPSRGDPPPDAPAHRREAEPGDKPAEPRLARDFAPRVLQHRWKKLLAAGKRIEELDVPSLHNVRLRAKRARYSAEMFAVLYEGKSAQRFIRRLSVLQQRLGVLNDGAVAAHLLHELGGASGRHAYAVGVVTGFTAARAGKMRPRIVRAFEKFRRQSSYWD